VSATLDPRSPRALQDGSHPQAGGIVLPPGRRRRRRSTRRTAWIAILPAALAVLIVIGYPVLDGIRLSFTDWGGVGKPDWVGLANYRTAAHTSSVRHSIVLTLEYAAACAAGMVVVGAVLAAAVSGKVKGAAFYRVVWFLPGVAPLTAVAVFWSAAFQPGSGAVNGFLDVIGLGKQHAWLASPNTAIYVVTLVTIWSGAGFVFLLLLGAIEQIPISLYEAASVDGASRVRQFFALTVPLIRPVLVISAMLELIWTANGFSVVWAMTQGGPGEATQTLPILVYRQAFSLGNYGLASAMAALSGVILLVIGLISLRLSRSSQAASRS
jgi:raffinose/stachyose/melibiose transport system permease protein